MTLNSKVAAPVILGVDPGTRITGYGIIRVFSDRVEPLDWGCIRPPVKLPLEDRYVTIHKGILELIKKFNPNFLVVETQFFQAQNPQSVLKLGMARGVIIVAARLCDIPVVEYAPTEAKLAITGTGRATKDQVKWMVQQILKLKTAPSPEDASDALALALCHARRRIK